MAECFFCHQEIPQGSCQITSRETGTNYGTCDECTHKLKRIGGCKCLGCGGNFPDIFRTVDRILCAKCHHDLELGRLVRGMKGGDVLYRDKGGWTVDPEGGDLQHGKTPEEALRGGKER